MMLRILCLDIEGGFGGSSRSLYESIRHFPKGTVSVSVICYKAGPIVSKYQEIGVDVSVAEMMPKVSALPKISRNLIAQSLALVGWFRSSRFREKIVTQSQEFDLIHLNHESLWWLARWLHPRIKIPIVMHIRTNPWPSMFGTIQAKSIVRSTDGIVFITEMEKKTLEGLAGTPVDGTVIHNIVSTLSPDDAPPQESERPYTVCCLSTFTYHRGIDRIVDIAVALKEMGKADSVRFVHCGNMAMTRHEAQILKLPYRTGITLADYAKARDVQSLIDFRGHVSHTNSILLSSDALIKPTREANPWGRDILEGLGAGLPVISFGTYNKFVENGKTGILNPEFDAVQVAKQILTLANNREKSKALGAAGRHRIQELCNGPERAADLLRYWHSVRTPKNDQ